MTMVDQESDEEVDHVKNLSELMIRLTRIEVVREEAVAQTENEISKMDPRHLMHQGKEVIMKQSKKILPGRRETANAMTNLSQATTEVELGAGMTMGDEKYPTLVVKSAVVAERGMTIPNLKTVPGERAAVERIEMLAKWMTAVAIVSDPAFPGHLRSRNLDHTKMIEAIKVFLTGNE